ncbi:MAG: iron-sulfur cluster assembly accessory protein [Spirochaetales bacterium]|nr:iron-sulfur cluster assembly accessory protein [Spirochaetales bacterium]
MAIHITEKAKNQLLSLNVNHQNFLRVWVEPGGCQGNHYRAAIDDQVEDTDLEIYSDTDLKIITDQDSQPYFAEVDVDYSDDLMKAGFKFVNRLAVSTCGCGSFKTA